MYKKSQIGSICALLEAQITKPTTTFAEWRPAAPQPPQFTTRLNRLPWDVGVRACFFIAAICAGILILDKFNLYFFSGSWINALIVWGAFPSIFSKAPESVKEMMDFPEVVPQYPVHVSILRGGVKVGTDVGVVTFSDHLLHFEGRKTSFGFARRDIFLTERPKKMRMTNRFQASVEWSYENGDGKLQIVPYGRVSGSKKRYGLDFKVAMWNWETSKSLSKFRSILPPRYPLDTEIRRAEALGRAGLWIVGVLAVPTPCLFLFLFCKDFLFRWQTVALLMAEIVLVKYIFKPQKERVILLESARDEELERIRLRSIGHLERSIKFPLPEKRLQL
jgi:hypothetical protein